MGRVVVVGSSNTDLTVQVPRIPRPGETVLGGRFYMVGGGKGANQAVAAVRVGAAVALIGRTGEDEFGRAAHERLETEGIDTTYLSSSEETASGVALIVVDGEGENAISVAPGANGELAPEDVEEAEPAIAVADVLVAQLEIPLETVERAFELAGRHAVTTILDPAPAQELPKDLLRRVSVITPNEMEAEALTGFSTGTSEGVPHAAERLLELGVETALVTLGPAGSYVAADDERFHVPGLEVEAVDSTAAGDVFVGALATALADGWGLRRSVDFANVAAALSVRTPGAQPSAPEREAVLSAGTGEEE